MVQNIFYQRKLPHWQPSNSVFFITYRLAGSIPVKIIQELKTSYNERRNNISSDLNRRKYFVDTEHCLDNTKNEPFWLNNSEVSKLVMESLLFNNMKFYKLWAACIMRNHVHIVVTTFPNSPPLHKILQNHKKFSAVYANKILNRKGQFWEEESYDTLIRDRQHFLNAVKYTICNPVKANLTDHWRNWPSTYLDSKLQSLF
jgi:REP element-mobilizing transposase RayT